MSDQYETAKEKSQIDYCSHLYMLACHRVPGNKYGHVHTDLLNLLRCILLYWGTRGIHGTVLSSSESPLDTSVRQWGLKFYRFCVKSQQYSDSKGLKEDEVLASIQKIQERKGRQKALEELRSKAEWAKEQRLLHRISQVGDFVEPFLLCCKPA